MIVYFVCYHTYICQWHYVDMGPSHPNAIRPFYPISKGHMTASRACILQPTVHHSFCSICSLLLRTSNKDATSSDWQWLEENNTVRRYILSGYCGRSGSQFMLVMCYSFLFLNKSMLLLFGASKRIYPQLSANLLKVVRLKSCIISVTQICKLFADAIQMSVVRPWYGLIILSKFRDCTILTQKSY